MTYNIKKNGIKKGKQNWALLKDGEVIKQSIYPETLLDSISEDDMKIKCQYCGKPFIPEHSNQKYCSIECYYNAQLEINENWKRKRERLIREGEFIDLKPSNNKLGDNKGLGGHRDKNFSKEYLKTQKELSRLKLR